MKKLFYFLTILGIVFTACENGGGVEDENKVTPFVPEISITPTTLNFSCNGGERAVDIIANFEYEVTERASWITIEQTDEGLLVVVDENKNTAERSAFISITNSQYDITKTIDVVQEAWVPKIDLAQQNIEVEFEPAEYEVAVTSPYSWEATTKNDWIEVKTETGIAGEEVLKFSVKRNEEMQERKGTITIKNSNYNLVVELYVTQKAFVPELTVEPESLSFAVEGGTQEIAITANFDYAYTANVDWVVLVKGENGIEVSVPNYVEVDERTAKITISSDKYGVSKTVDVTQGAFVPELTVEPESLSFAVEGGTQEIAITANFEYTYTTDADWVVLNKTTNGLEVTVQNAVAFENRMAEVIISSDRYEVSKKVCISQKALSKDATNAIFYTSNNGEIVVPYKMDVFGANIMSNTYNNGMGLIFFDAPIASIGDYAFYNCRGLTSVKIPGNVTSIGDYAFEGCTNLKKVDILDLSTWCKIDFKNSAACPLYNGAELYINGEKAIKITIPSDISRIEHYAFYHCESLEEVAISDNVTYISNSAFSQCSNLSKVTIGRGVETIHNHAFSYCNTLKSISIPANVKNLGGSLFKNCKALERATIESNIQTLPQSIFNGCSALTDVVIPNSITEIGDYAFQNCNCLPNIIIPEEVTSIGYSAFKGCTSLTSITIPNSLTSIKSSVFEGCTGLISITIPNSVTSIESSVFEGCTGLTSITIPNSVTSIGSFAFKGCAGLTSATISNGVTSIGFSAFYGCTGKLIINSKIVETDYTSSNYPMNSNNGWLYGSKFNQLTIGNNITKIGNYEFQSCNSLTSITIPNSVTSIGINAFYGCTGELVINSKIVETSYLDSPMNNNGWLYGSKFTKLAIGNDITKIGQRAFKGCSNLTSVIIGNGITSIGYSAFYGCSSLNSVTIGNGVTSIGEWAFRDCSSLNRVNISNLSAWCKIYFGDSSANPLYYAEKLYLNDTEVTELTIPSDIAVIERYTFNNYRSLKSVTIPDSVTSIGKSAFSDCSSLNCVRIGNGVTSIGYRSFYNCSGLTNVMIPNSITSIGEEAFFQCSSLSSMTIPNGVTSIGNKAFYGCTGELVINNKILLETDYTSSNYPIYSSTGWLYGSMFTKLTIGNDITKIGALAFKGCSNLTSVTIPNSVTSIGESAFDDCSSLTGVYISDLSAWCKIDFGNSYANPLDYAKKLYLNDTEVTELTIPSDVAVIKSYAFYGCYSLTSVTIPNSVTSIGNSAFGSCHSLTSVTIGNSVTSIGRDAFRSCEHLTSVIIGNGVTSIGNLAFYYCTSLTSVTIPNSVTSIGNSAFGSCHSLTSVTIGNSVTSIGNSAFGYCRKLIGVKIGNSVTTIGTEAFYECSSLISVTIPDSVTSIGREAFMYCTSLTSVTIGNSVTSIGQSAFEYCRNLINVYCKPIIPPTGGSSMFNGIASGRKIYVPHNSASAYKTATYWSEYASSIVGYDFE